jgi:hypothetical protein
MTIAITQNLETLGRRIAELEADIALLSGVIQHLERVSPLAKEPMSLLDTITKDGSNPAGADERWASPV